MTQPAVQITAKPASFGHQDLAEQLAERLHRHFSKPDDVNAAFVIGLFGEWGSGKSYMLDLVRKAFESQDRQAVQDKQPNITTIIVPFNPWRYEKEVHLIVPLLKHLAFELEKLVISSKVEKQQDHKLVKALTFVKHSLIAFVSGLSASIDIDTKIFGKIGIDISADDMINRYDELQKAFKAAQEKANKPDGVHALDSYYYDFNTHLKRIVNGDTTDTPALHLLFLIDDLDRCLPEKAVEMLESIKLFLDVAGCAFVLAVDDEVVERGILHRYRDYIFQGNKTAHDSGNTLASLPITGTEYLEKIIQLPFRLPLLQTSQVKTFLQDTFADFFTQALANTKSDVSIDKGKEHDRDEMAHIASHNRQHCNNEGGTLTAQQAQDLIRLFSTHVPFVPRKLIRTVELYRLLVKTAVARNIWQHIDHEILGIMVLLQLYAPDLYRYAQKHYDNVLVLLASWAGNQALPWTREAFARSWDFTPEEIASTQTTDWAQVSSNDEENLYRENILNRIKDRGNYERYYQPIIAKLNQARAARSGFDPYHLIAQNLPAIARVGVQASQYKDPWKLYFSLSDSGEKVAGSPSAAIDTAVVDYRSEAALSDAAAFWDALLSSEASNWAQAIKQIDTATQRLSDADFVTLQTLLKALKTDTTQYWPRMEALLPALTAQQTQDLKLQATALTAIETPLVADANIPVIHARAAMGRVLGLLGDTRDGVGTRKSADGKSDLPAFKWIDIPATDAFLMGSDANDKLAYDDEKRAASFKPIAIKAFQIAAYPVTNAQYACFVQAGMYNDAAFWERLGGAEAYQWWSRSETRKPSGHRVPFYWGHAQWCVSNHPVVGINFFEALAYITWLNDVLKPPATHEYALASESEWEYSARGEFKKYYPWGNRTVSPALANYEATALQRTTAVGLFAENQSFKGLYDQSGNVCEWTCFRHKSSVLRGGAWNLYPSHTNAVFRVEGDYWNHYDYVGFRIVYRASNVSAVPYSKALNFNISMPTSLPPLIMSKVNMNMLKAKREPQ